ncbi:MAG: EamA family transporter [Saprospiraceae bacterium]|nr:EamA family transporter [Saprospiraceae bacterium]
MLKFYIAFLLGVILTAIAQVCLKLGANRSRRKINMKLFFNRWTLSGYLLFFSVMLFNTYGFTKLPITTIIIFNPIVYILVAILSFAILKEKLTRSQLSGSIIIIVGIVIFSLGNLVK